MVKNKFSKPPLNFNEREKKIEAFMNLSSFSAPLGEDSLEKFKKEKAKPIYLRAPESLWNDIHEIMARTGLSMNAICLDLLSPEVKKKLKCIRDW